MVSDAMESKTSTARYGGPRNRGAHAYGVNIPKKDEEMGGSNVVFDGFKTAGEGAGGHAGDGHLELVSPLHLHEAPSE